MPDDRSRMSPTPQEEQRGESNDLTAFEELSDLPFSGGRVIPWRNAWQLPVAFMCMVLIAAGFWTIKQGIVLPDPDALLSTGELCVAEGRLDEAQEYLDRALPFIPAEDTAQQARVFAIRADLEARRPRFERRDRLVLDFYEHARQLGRPLTPQQEARRAASLAALGNHEAAFAHLFESADADLDEGTKSVQRRVLRALVEEAQSGDDALRGLLIPVLDRYAASEYRAIDDCAWASMAAARLRLDSGDPGNGLEHFMRAMRRIDAREDEDADQLAVRSEWLGRMYGTLGRLWLALEDRDAARNALEVALQRLELGDEERRRAQAAMAWIEFADGNYDEAITRFEAVLAANPSLMTQLEVKLWRAEAHAALGEHDLAEQDYADVLAAIPHASHPMAQRTTLSLGDRVRESVLQSTPDRAIRFGEMLLASKHIQPDVEVLVHTADAHRARGSGILGGNDSAVDLHAVRKEAITPAARREASLHFRRAGTLYSVLAGRLLYVPGEHEGWARAQAASGECFDLGADRGSALHAYETYLESTDEKDMQRARIAYRYARALHSAFRFDEALAAYDDLVSRHGRGAYAATARVGSAGCLVELSRPQEARARLESIVSGAAGIRPEALEYREAKFALGSLLWDMGQFRGAVSTLDESIRRYPDDERIPRVAYMLGSAYRNLAAAEFVRRMDSLNSPSERAVSSRQYSEHLERASVAFDLVILAFVARDPTTLDQLQVEMLRDSSVARADAVFELGEYEECVSLLEDIERRYRNESTSLDALIRLVEVWDALGDRDMAEKTHRRAELRLRQLPEEAFDFPASRFDRDAWRIWIERRPLRGVQAMAQE